MGESTRKAQTQPGDPHLPGSGRELCAEKKVDELTWDFVGVVWGVHTSNLESDCSCWVSWCHVGCPDIAEQCHCEQPCNCSPKVSLEKILGNVQLLHIIAGFRTKPGTLNHISPFILTVQTLTAGKAVPNILIAAWAGGRDISVEILLVPAAWPWTSGGRCGGLLPSPREGWGGMFGAEVWDPNRAQRLFSAPLCMTTVNVIFVKTLLITCSWKSLIRKGKAAVGPSCHRNIVWGRGAQPLRLLELLHLKISVVLSTPLSKHWPQLAAKAGQEFIFISWNSVDLKSLLNVNFQKAHASAFWATAGRKKNQIIENIN